MPCFDVPCGGSRMTSSHAVARKQVDKQVQVNPGTHGKRFTRDLHILPRLRDFNSVVRQMTRNVLRVAPNSQFLASCQVGAPPPNPPTPLTVRGDRGIGAGWQKTSNGDQKEDDQDLSPQHWRQQVITAASFSLI